MSPFTQHGYLLMAPEVLLTLLGIGLLLVSVFTKHPEHRLNRAVPIVAVIGLAAAFATVLWVGYTISSLSLSEAALDVDRGGHLRVDMLSLFFKGIAIVTSLLVVLSAVDYSRKFSSPGEFFGLLVLTTLAVSLLSSAADLVTIYLSMEFLSISSYAMAGYYRENPRSSEAALKYFLFGAANSALMLYGMSLLYGLSATGTMGQPATTHLSDVIRGIATQPPSPLVLMAVVFTLSGFLFKISAVPFHQWAPDTYQGAPTPLVAFLSVASKAGGIAVLVRVLATSALLTQADTGVSYTMPEVAMFLAAIVSALSMFLGNLVAIQQRDIKRLLAYSGIAQIGYMLIALVAMRGANSDQAIQALVIYLVVYLFTNLGAFAVATAINNRIHSSDLDDYAGLARRSPWLAAAMAVFMFSLAGVPPAAGWFGKYYIFQAAVDPSLRGIFAGGSLNATDVQAFLLVINSVIGAFYYLWVAKRMYFDDPEVVADVPVEGALRFAILASMVITLALGSIAVGPMVRLVQDNATFRVDPAPAPVTTMPPAAGQAVTPLPAP